MSEQRINPNHVTKPIQLLAAWLVGLILINGSFLGAARVLSSPEWASGLLVIAAVCNVPIFLGLIFFLQTKFRAELQEDTYYSKHLEKITGTVKDRVKSNDFLLDEIKKFHNLNNDKIEAIENNLENIYNRLSNQDVNEIDVRSVLEKISETKASLSSYELQKNKSSTQIALNDLIPNHKEIAKKIITSGYFISEIFGSTSVDKKPPTCLTISYNSSTPKLALREVYEILKPYGFDRIDYDNSENFPDDSDIYIGSYIDDFSSSRRSVKIDETIEALLLNNDISSEQLGSYILLQRT